MGCETREAPAALEPEPEPEPESPPEPPPTEPPVAAIPDPPATRCDDPLAGVWIGEDGDRNGVHVEYRLDIARASRNVLRGEIHTRTETRREIRMAARGRITKGTVHFEARRLGVARAEGPAPEPGEISLLEWSVEMPAAVTQALDWTISTPAVGGRTIGGRFRPTPRFWWPCAQKVRMTHVACAPRTTPDLPALEPAAPERICPL